MNPLRIPGFRWYFTGRAVSVLGSAMTPVALAFAVLQATDDPKFLGYVLAAAFVPMLALMVVGGGVADRLRQDRLLMATSVGSGLAMGAQALCVLTHQRVWLLIPLAFVNGVLQAFAGPATNGIVPKLVPRELLQKANSLLSSSRSAAQILGPTTAGVLVATVGGGWGMAADALSFFVSAACLSRLSLPDQVGRGRAGLLRDLREGWRYFRTTAWMWPVSLAFTVINVIQLGVWQVLGPVLAKGSIGAGSWGVVLSVRAAGMLVMSTLMLRITVHRPLLSALPVLALAGTPLVLLGLRAGAPALAAGAFLAGLAGAFYSVLEDTTRHTHIPQDMMSRATAIDDFGSYVAIPVGQLSALPLAAAFGDTRVAVGGGIAYALVALAPLASGAVRRLGADAVMEEAEAAVA